MILKIIPIVVSIIYVLFILYIMLFLGYMSCLTLIISFKDFPFQTIIFILFSLGIVLLLWLILFVKIKFYNKFLAFVLILLFIRFLFIIPAVKYAIDVDTCIDTGICKEGVETKIDNELNKINKENCLKYHKEWYDSINSCNIR